MTGQMTEEKAVLSLISDTRCTIPSELWWRRILNPILYIQPYHQPHVKDQHLHTREGSVCLWKCTSAAHVRALTEDSCVGAPGTASVTAGGWTLWGAVSKAYMFWGVWLRAAFRVLLQNIPPKTIFIILFFCGSGIQERLSWAHLPQDPSYSQDTGLVPVICRLTGAGDLLPRLFSHLTSK